MSEKTIQKGENAKMKYPINTKGIIVETDISPLFVMVKGYDPVRDVYYLNDGSSTPIEIASKVMETKFIPGDSMDFVVKSSYPGEVYYGHAYELDDDENPFRSNSWQNSIELSHFDDDDKFEEELSEATKMFVGEHKSLREAAEELINTEMLEQLPYNIHSVSSHKEAIEIFKKSDYGFVAYIIKRNIVPPAAVTNSQNTSFILPKPKSLVYQESESVFKELFEKHILKETGVEVNLEFSVDDETLRLYIGIKEDVEDERFWKKYNPEEQADFATKLCDEVFAEGKEKCYPQYIELGTDTIEIFVEID